MPVAEQPVLLQLGGLLRASRSGWTIVNTCGEEDEGVNVVASMTSLPSFSNDSVTAIYCCHTLEYLSLSYTETQNVYAALSEWHRILRHGR